MSSLLRDLIAAACLAALCVTPATAAPVTITSADGIFTAEMTDPPAHEVSKQPTPFGEVKTEIWKGRKGNGLPQWLAIYTDKMPPGYSMDNVIKDLKGQAPAIVWSEPMPIRVHDAAGYETTMRKAETVTRARFFLRNGRFFYLAVIGLHGQEKEADAEAFLKSLRVKDQIAR